MEYQFDELPDRIHSKYLRSLLKSLVAFFCTEPKSPKNTVTQTRLLLHIVVFFLTEKDIKPFEINDIKALAKAVLTKVKARGNDLAGFYQKNNAYISDITKIIMISLKDESVEEQKRGRLF